MVVRGHVLRKSLVFMSSFTTLRREGREGGREGGKGGREGREGGREEEGREGGREEGGREGGREEEGREGGRGGREGVGIQRAFLLLCKKQLRSPFFIIILN